MESMSGGNFKLEYNLANLILQKFTLLQFLSIEQIKAQLNQTAKPFDMKEYIREYESIFSDCKINKVYMPFLHTESMYFQSLYSNEFKSSSIAKGVNHNHRFKSNSLNRLSDEYKNNDNKLNADENKLLESTNMSSTITGKSIIIDLNADVYFTQSNIKPFQFILGIITF
jgi:hypothetical protein